MFSTLKTITLLVLLLLLSQTVHAHIAGVTDTSVQISANGLKLIYTVPADNLQELNLADSADKKTIESAVFNGFELHNGDLACKATESASRSLTQIGSEQFEYKVDCFQPIKTLEIRYHLFFDVEKSHKNFSRITLLNRTQNITFTADNKSHQVEVEKLVLAWVARRNANKTPKKTEQSSSHYFPVGIEHIVFGFDHLLFLLALLLLPLKLRQLLALITSFTLAHSITLALSVLDVVTLPALYVEAAIAFSIVYVAVETTLVLRNPQFQAFDNSVWKRRLINTFLFGLIHGFGFSFILKTMGLGNQVTAALLYFNLGVEVGQILAVLIAFPVLVLLFKRYKQLRWAQYTSIGIGLVGLYWMIERVVALY